MRQRRRCVKIIIVKESKQVLLEGKVEDLLKRAKLCIQNNNMELSQYTKLLKFMGSGVTRSDIISIINQLDSDKIYDYKDKVEIVDDSGKSHYAYGFCRFKQTVKLHKKLTSVFVEIYFTKTKSDADDNLVLGNGKNSWKIFVSKLNFVHVWSAHEDEYVDGGSNETQIQKAGMDKHQKTKRESLFTERLLLNMRNHKI